MAQISYTDALTTLSAMFGDVESTVIKMVLDSNRGHMERTVEQLLALSGDATTNKPAEADKQADGQTGSQGSKSSSEQKQTDSAKAQTSSSQEFKLSHRLPPDFLRPPSFFAPPAPNQIDADRQFAQAIQDSMLMSQMRRRPERFMYPNSRRTQNSSSDDAPISETLSQLGEKARQKLAALGARFQRRQQTRNQSNGRIDDSGHRYANIDDADDSSLLTREPDSSFTIGDPDGSVELQDMRFPRDQSSDNARPNSLQPL